jgi:hypothetical protein
MATPVTEKLETPAPSARMPYYFAPFNLFSIRNDIHFALDKLKGTEFAGQRFLENFTSKINTRIDFCKQDFTEDDAYKKFLAAVAQLKRLKSEDLLKDQTLAKPLLANAEKTFQQFLEQRKAKFYRSVVASNDKEEKRREKLWSTYEKALTQTYQPINQFSQKLAPNHLYTQAMRDYVQNDMGQKGKRTATEHLKVKNLDFVPQAYFRGENGKPIIVQYDKKNQVAEVKFQPGKGSLRDALAISISAKNGPPFTVTCSKLSYDIIQNKMEPGLLQLLTIGMYIIANYFVERAQKQEYLRAIKDLGLPPEQVSLVDNKGQPIKISDEAIAKLKCANEKWVAAELTKAEQKTTENKQEEAQEAVTPSSRPVRTMGR